MKIGLFFGSFTGAGAERMMINLGKGMSDLGHQITIYVVNNAGPFSNIVPSDIKIVSLNGRYGVKSVIPKIRQVLKANILDAFISTQEHINASVAIASMGFKDKPVLIFRESSTPSRRNHKLFERIINHYTFRFSDKYVAVSNSARKDIITYYSYNPDDVVTIYNPIIDNSITKLMHEKAEDPWFRNTAESPVIMGMGRIVPLKRFEDLIEAVALLRNHIPAKLVILGRVREDTEYWSLLQRKIKDFDLTDVVKFPGFVSNPFKYLRKASLFALSSSYEGLPGSLVQAMACGCPVVSTDCASGPGEILENGEYGPLVEVGNPQMLADAMERTLIDPISSSTLKERAGFFSVERAAHKYLKLIEAIK